MKIQPLSKAIYDKAKLLGVKVISLKFSGGSDEGFLNVELDYPRDSMPDPEDFISEITDWVWNVYSYSGAGDGNNYGDTIEYDLVAGLCSSQEWYMTQAEGAKEKETLAIA